jgi:AcrR family transcriptional regulator
MTASAPSRRDTRGLILDACEKIVAGAGSRSLTIDAVVDMTGLSKGGVLYHFPNKTALLAGMVDRMVDSVRGDIDAADARAVRDGGSAAVEIVSSLLTRGPKDKQVSQALLAAIAEQPDLLDPARALIEMIDDRLADTAVDPVLMHIITLAIDGLHHRDLLGFPAFDPHTRDAVQRRLIAMTKDLHP